MINDPRIIKEILEKLDNTPAVTMQELQAINKKCQELGWVK